MESPKTFADKLLIGFAVAFVSILLLSQRGGTFNEAVDEVGRARVFTTLNYCSSDADTQCAPNTAWLRIRPFARREDVSLRHNRNPVTNLSLILDEVEAKLNVRALDRLPEDIWLVADSNNSGGIDPGDAKIARGLVKKKTVLFEDIQYSLVNEDIPPEGYQQAELFFISSFDQQWDLAHNIYEDEAGELASERIFDEVSSRVIDVGDDNRELLDKGVFADLSLFEYRDKQQQPKADFLAENPLFEDRGSGVLGWTEGHYEIEKDLVIPDGLRIQVDPGVDIRIGADVSVLSYSPINFNGTAASPITIDKLGTDPFATFAVIGRINSPHNILVNHTHVAGGKDDHINGIVATGMMSIFRFNKVTVTNSSFTGSVSDDGLNIKNSGILLENNIFDSNSADAFDGDFVVGPIRNNYFIENGNDSLDFSGSDVTIQENRIIDSGDKCISIGEGTDLLAERNILSGCSIGSEVKDRSNATINNNLISDSTAFGLNSFIKKFFFGEPSSTHNGNYFANNEANYGGLIEPNVENNRFYKTTTDAIKEIPWYQEVLKETSLQ